MRRRTINHLFDSIFWYFLYLLPLIALVILLAKNGATDFSIVSAFDSLGLNLLTTNPILDSLSSVFGNGGVLPFFVNDDALVFVSYYICIFILHIFVDFLLFIPKLAMSWMDKIGGNHD